MSSVRYLGVSPMCGSQPGLGDPEFYAAISKDTEAAMYWRVKEYRFTGSTASGDFESYYVSNCASERELVVPESNTFTQTYDTWTGTPPSPEERLSSAVIIYPGYSGYWEDSFYVEDGVRYLRMSVYAEDGPTVLMGSFSFYGSPNGTSKLLMLGEEYFFPVFYETGSSSAVVEVTKYWPYDPGDGLGPIYDEDTGAQLRDFPSL